MEWIKGRTSFIIGSDRWLGGSSSAQSAQQASSQSAQQASAQPAAQQASAQQSTGMPTPAPPQGAKSNGGESSSLYPTIEQYNPLGGFKVRSPTREESLDKTTASKLYPPVYNSVGEKAEVPQFEDGNQDDNVAVEGVEEVLVKVADAMAHLVDHEESVLLATGEFSLVKLSQNGAPVAVFARVGNELQWPLVKDEPATRLDASHYVFSLRVVPEDSQDDKAATESLNYGVTFNLDGNTKGLLQELDKILEQYSYFSAPTMLQASEEEISKVDTTKVQQAKDASQLPLPGKPVSSDVVTGAKPSEEVSTAYWTTLAPNVDDYNSSLARAIASGTGHIIRGIFWCSDSTVAQLERTGKFVKTRSNACTQPSSVNPRTMRNIRRAKRVTKMSEKVAKGVLTGVVSVTSYFTTTVVNSRAGKKFFKFMPGEVALASLEGFGKIFDAMEVAGTNVLSTTSVVTTGAVTHRYGEQAGELAQEGLSTAGHLFGVAWTISKLRNAFNPKNAMKPTAVLRTAAKAAASEKKK